MTTTDWIQAISTLVLVAVTGVYAWRTFAISKATQKQAEASVKMAKEMRAQRYDTVRPVIDIQLHLYGDTKMSAGLMVSSGDLSSGLSCILHNIGLGPALDVYSFIQDFRRERQRFDFGTLAIDGNTKPISLSLNQEDNRKTLVVYYKDVYGRAFKSSREVNFREKSLELGPLKPCLVQEDGKHDS